MSSPSRIASPVVHQKKRVLSDSEETSSPERGVKRAKSVAVPADNNKWKDKDRKRRRKKKKKHPIVQPVDVSEEERIASGSAAAEPRKPPSVATSARASLEESRHASPAASRRPSAGPSTVVEDTRRQEPERDPPQPSTTDEAGSSKEKYMASAPPEDHLEAVGLKTQLSAKTSLLAEHITLVSTLQTSLTCQICLDLMYKPYTLTPCGHSACYECLVAWFRAPPADGDHENALPTWMRKKTCPHCRAVVVERPVEVWAVKDMVAALAKSGLAELPVPPPPSAAAPAGALADPWEDIFRRPGRAAPGHGAALADILDMFGAHDAEDGGVYRCVDCQHEIWDAVCSGCGRGYPGHEFDEDDGDEDGGFHPWGALLDGDDWSEDALGELYFPGGYDSGGDTEVEVDDAHAHVYGAPPRIVDPSTDESSDNEQEYEGSFIDDEDDRGPPPRDEDSDEAFVARMPRRARGQALIVISDEEEEAPRAGPSRARGSRPVALSDPIVLSSDDERDDLAKEVAAREREIYGDDGSVQRNRRHPHHPIWESDEEIEIEEDEY